MLAGCVMRTPPCRLEGAPRPASTCRVPAACRAPRWALRSQPSLSRSTCSRGGFRWAEGGAGSTGSVFTGGKLPCLQGPGRRGGQDPKSHGTLPREGGGQLSGRGSRLPNPSAGVTGSPGAAYVHGSGVLGGGAEAGLHPWRSRWPRGLPGGRPYASLN